MHTQREKSLAEISILPQLLSSKMLTVYPFLPLTASNTH